MAGKRAVSPEDFIPPEPEDDEPEPFDEEVIQQQQSHQETLKSRINELMRKAFGGK